MTAEAINKSPEASSLAAVIRQKLEEVILNGEFLPGDRLNELALAERFGVSRGPIREAMRSLEYARLVSIIPNRGVVVRTVDLPEALELYEVRAGLARAAGRLAAIRATADQLQVLAELHKGMKEAIAVNDSASFNSSNHAFHDSILTFAANSRLQELDLSVRNEMQLYIRTGISGDAQLRMSNAEHGRILAAMNSGDAEAAGFEFEQHILKGKQRMLENLRSGSAQRTG